jgi:sodium/potassium-transporting ATPase subunit beta
LKDHIAGQADKDQVWVECHGEYPADKEALGAVNYFPNTQGFPGKAFPYMNQKNYQSPLIAVQFANAAHNQLLHIECRAWAQNIGYNKRDRIGINHLELLILDNESAPKIGS